MGGGGGKGGEQLPRRESEFMGERDHAYSVRFGFKTTDVVEEANTCRPQPRHTLPQLHHRPFLLALPHRPTKDGTRMRVQLYHVFQLHPTGLVRRCYSFRCFRGSTDSRDEELDTANYKLCMDTNRPGDASAWCLLPFAWRRRRLRHEWQDAEGA